MLTSIIVAVLVFVLVTWLIGYIPLPADTTLPIKQILYVIALVALILYLVKFL